MRLLGRLVVDGPDAANRLVLLSEEEYQELQAFISGASNDDMQILKRLRRRADLARLLKHLETLTEVLARQETGSDEPA